MAVTAEALRAGLQRWAREQASTLEALQRALEIVYRDRPGARTLDELATALLLAVARRHEGRVGSALGRLDGALGRLLDDLEALRTAASEGRAPALREADLYVVAEALAEMVRFEDRVRFMLDENATEVQSTLRQILAGPPAHGRPAAGTGLDEAAHAALGAGRGTQRTVTQSLELARHIIDEADEVLTAWRQGWTREPAGVAPVRVTWPDHPVLVAEMHRMQDAVDAFRAAAPGLSDPAAAVRAVEDLQRAVSEGNETLRGFGRRFESTTAGDRLPPGRVPAGTTPPPGSPAADALAAQGRVAALTGAAATPAELSEALRFGDLEVRATGTLSEPLARTVAGMGQERYALRPSQIRALPTSPPWLAGRLADLVAGWERAHLIGPGFGGELFAGLMLAPGGVNQLAQNRGAERILRQLAEASRRAGGPDITPTVRATGRRLAIPLANGGFEHIDLLTSVHYELPRPGRSPVHIDIHVDPDGSWRVTHDLPAGTWPADTPLSGTR